MYDLIVIGAGPGGYTAAIKAAKRGLNTAIVEPAQFGGACLNRGCIPTKYLITEMHKYVDTLKCLKTGIYSGDVSLNYSFLKEKLCDSITQLSDGINLLLNKNKVSIFRGNAKLIDASHVNIEETNTILEAKNIVIATGSRPVILDVNYIKDEGQKRVFTTDNLFEEMDYIPKTLAIVGAGVVGLELAFIYSGFGSKVTIVEQQKHLLGDFDHDVNIEIMRMLKKKDIDIIFEASIDEIFADDKEVVVYDPDENVLVAAEVLICAAGRIPQTENLNIENIGIVYENAGIQVDENLQTTCSNIYAIGDVNGIKPYAYMATAQAENVIATICGQSKCKDIRIIPQCIFADTEIAYVGLTEKEANEKKIGIKCSKYLMSANGRSRIDEKGGFIKIVTDEKTDEILGGVCVCHNASEIISNLTIAINNKLTIADFDLNIFPHPTYSESLSDAVQLVKNNSTYFL